METGTIYCLENLITGKMYIGKTIDFDWRMYEYASGNSHSGWITNSIAKHGWENFAVKQVETIPVEELDEAERFWIAFLNCQAPNGYNLTDGGQGGRQVESVRKQMSQRASEINRQRVAEGTHHFVTNNPSTQRIQAGTHHWQNKESQQRNADAVRQRVAAGTHHWQTEEHRKRVSEHQQQLVADGTHTFITNNQNERRLKDGTHNFLTQPNPMKDPEKVKQMLRTRRKNRGTIDWVDQLEEE